MPITRELTPDELQGLENQGIDSSAYKGKQLTLATDDEVAQQSAPPVAQKEPLGKLQTIGRTAKAHAGGYLGGGAGLAAASWLLGPEVGLPTSLIVGGLSAAGGAYGGQKLQDIAQGDELTGRLQQEAAEGEEANPNTALGTDIVGSALAGGGKPNLSNIGKAITGNKEALAKLAIGSIVNPAINTGIDLATTGQLPTGRDLIGQVAGGALFSEHSALGRMVHGSGKHVEINTETPPVDDIKTTPEPTDKGVPTEEQKPDWNKLSPAEEQQKKDWAKRFEKPTPAQDYADSLELDRHFQQQNKLNKQTETQRQQKSNDYSKMIAEKTSQDFENRPLTENQARIINPDTLLKSDLDRGESFDRNLYAPSDDRKTYDDLKAKFQDMMQKGQTSTPEFQETWKKMEEVKNKNGGMPPPAEGDVNSPKGWEEISQSNDRPKQVALEDHIRTGTATTGSVLQHLSGMDNEFAPLAKHMLENASPEKLADRVKFSGNPQDAYYNIPSKVTRVGSERIDSSVLVHEMGHSLISNNLPPEFNGLRGSRLKAAMDGYLADPKGNPHIKELIQTYYEAAKGLKIHDLLFDEKTRFGDNIGGLAGAPREAQNVMGDKGYAMSTLHEFTTMSLSHSKFQKKLNELSSGKSNGKSLWSRFVDAVRGILGVPVKERSLLERALKVNEELIKMPRTENKTPDFDIGHPKDNLDRDENTYGHWIRPDGTVRKIILGKSSHEREAIEELKKLVKDGKMSKQDYDKLNIPLNSTSEVESALHNRGYIRGVRMSPDSYFSNGDYAKYKLTYQQERFLKNYGIENDLKMTHLGKEGDSIGKTIHDPETGETNLNAPAKLGTKPDDETHHMGWLGNTTRSMIDKIRDIKHPAATELADSFHKALNTAQELNGKWTNKIVEAGKKLTAQDKETFNRIADYENANGTQAPSSMFKNVRVREFYNLERKLYDESGKHQLKINEPVMRNGTPTALVQKPFAHPTTLRPEIDEVIKKNTDQPAIAKLGKDYVDNQIAYGKSPTEAAKQWEDFKSNLQGNAFNSAANMQHYNAVRREQGIPLPKSFQRLDPVENLQYYYNRRATDNGFYEHVESNPKAMAALGQTKDAWNKPITKSSDGSLANNPTVQNQLKEFQGEKGTPGAHNESAASALATTLLISQPGLEVHKVGSNLITALTGYVDNPVQMGRVLGAMVKNFTSGLKTAKENGVIKFNAKSFSDVFKETSTAADRLQALAQGVRNISSVGGLTDKFSAGLMQAGLEAAVPMKVSAANNGNESAQQLMRRIDPDYKVGKSYTDEEVGKLASRLAGYIHGTGDGRTMPAWMTSDTELSGFFKLAHWSVSQTNRFMTDVWTPATKGNYAPLITSMFGGVIGGYVIKQIREELQGKKGQIPSLSEIGNSEGGFGGNKPLLAYNAIAAAQYAGFGGLLSQIAKYPFDIIYKNSPQGATFPLDQAASDIVKTASEVGTAIANDPKVNYLELTSHVFGHLLSSNIGLARVGLNQAINNGLITGTIAEKKELSDKLGQLRRFDMVSGLPYDTADTAANPYMNLEQKKFKMEQDPQKAVAMIPDLVQTLIKKYGDKPDILLSKLKGLKENEYATFPSLESTPLSFTKYLTYLKKEEGPEAAQAALEDYFRHKLINEAKGSVVP